MPTPLIIDTDPGVDDAVALVLALHSPEVEVVAVTASFGNIGLAGTYANARRVLALAGRADVPVAAGAARPLVHLDNAWASEWHGADGLGGRATAFPDPGPDGGTVACDFGPARGTTVADRRPGADGPPVHVAVDADVDAVLAAVLERVGRLG